VPCFNPEGDIEFYLPEGDWCWFGLLASSSEVLTGGKVYQRSIALDCMAVFTKIDSEIPLNMTVLNTMDIPIDEMGMFEVSEYWSYSKE
jgi:alpha-D-xyloside xylohydrolase